MSHPRERHGTRPEQIRPAHSILAVIHHSKEPQQNRNTARSRRGINISGVDFWHAVEFSRNGRFHRNPPGPLRALPFTSSRLSDPRTASLTPTGGAPHSLHSLQFPQAFRPFGSRTLPDHSGRPDSRTLPEQTPAQRQPKRERHRASFIRNAAPGPSAPSVRPVLPAKRP
jgi:hypothetical protein